MPVPIVAPGFISVGENPTTAKLPGAIPALYYTESATVTSVTTIGAAESQNIGNLASTIVSVKPIIAPRFISILPTPVIRPAVPPFKPGIEDTEIAIISSSTKLSAVENAQYTDAATISHTTKLTVVFLEVVNISTTNYYWDPWFLSYTYDSSSTYAGSVGSNDHDDGRLV